MTVGWGFVDIRTQRKLRQIKEETNVTTIAKKESAPLAQVEATPEAMLQQAIAAGLAPEAMEKFYELFRQMKADQARAAFHAAYARFKDICPPVQKRTQNSQFAKKIVNRDGSSTTKPRMYASLEDIGATVKPHLASCGLSYRFGNMEVREGMLTVSCIVSHESGHSETSAAMMPVESKAGCSEQQKYGAAETYARRSALKNALGIVEADEDDDGNEGGPAITEHQRDTLDTMLSEFPPDRRAKFLAKIGYPSLAEIPASRYTEAVQMIESARRASK